MIKNTSAPHNQQSGVMLRHFVFLFSIFHNDLHHCCCFLISKISFSVFLLLLVSLHFVWFEGRQREKKRGRGKMHGFFGRREMELGKENLEGLSSIGSTFLFPSRLKGNERKEMREKTDCIGGFFFISFLSYNLNTLNENISLFSFLSFTLNSSMLANFSEDQRSIIMSLIICLNCKFL